MIPRKITADETEITITAEVDDIPVRGNAVASGDDAADRAVEDEIIDRLDRGDVWAWAFVTVTVEWKGFEGTASLGACSYASEREFRRDPYFADLAREALDNLNAEIAKAAQKIERLGV